MSDRRKIAFAIRIENPVRIRREYNADLFLGDRKIGRVERAGGETGGGGYHAGDYKAYITGYHRVVALSETLRGLDEDLRDPEIRAEINELLKDGYG